MRKLFFARMARQNLLRNRRLFFPYLLTVMGTAAAFYIVSALASSSNLPVMTRYAYLSMFMTIGVFVISLFAIIFLFYTNSFLMKQRKRELGLYNILGLGKRHIGLMLGVETLYTALIGIGGGLALGIVLQKLVTLLLCRIMHTEAYFGFYISTHGVCWTAALFGGILLCNLLMNLLRVRVQSPMEMLHESNAGEKEPKTKWVLTVLGVVCLGGGYAIALLTRSATAALAFYFIAVFLVIFGTYFLFTAISITVLKGLRHNKRYYYQTNHFIGVSGMLYRMKRNAVGLANICILSTMVLVMVSGTLSLYLNSENTMNTQFAGNIRISMRYDPSKDAPFEARALEAAMPEALRASGTTGVPVYAYHSLSLDASERDGGGFDIHDGYDGVTCQLRFLSTEDYVGITDVAPGEAEELPLVFPNGKTVTVTARPLTEATPATGGAFATTTAPVWYLLPDASALRQLWDAQSAALGEGAERMDWYGFYNIGGTEDEQADAAGALESHLADTDMGEWDRLEVESQADFGREYYSLNGGFFFLGLFLGLLFIMATVLIIYYKQVSEGYEDRERYRIMEQVGMDRKTVRSSINSQILVVFFAPLLVAAVHVTFDFGLMTKLLTLFGLYDSAATLWCTVGTFGAFAAIYALVYWATARVYYKIVE